LALARSRPIFIPSQPRETSAASAHGRETALLAGPDTETAETILLCEIVEPAGEKHGCGTLAPSACAPIRRGIDQRQVQRDPEV
jgi:hypothetical protein